MDGCGRRLVFTDKETAFRSCMNISVDDIYEYKLVGKLKKK